MFGQILSNRLFVAANPLVVSRTMASQYGLWPRGRGKRHQKYVPDETLKPTEYKFSNKHHLKWVKPTPIPFSSPLRTGDRSPTLEVDKAAIPEMYELSTELKNADKDVQRLFSLEFQRPGVVYNYKKTQMMRSVQRHCLDVRSPEVMIAKLTARLRHLQSIVNDPAWRRNGCMITELNNLISKRRAKLAKLRQRDYKCFEWLLERLDLEYKELPKEKVIISRKPALLQMTRTYCDEIRDGRLAEYRQQLEDAQLPFLEQKLSNLKYIQSEQEAMGCEVTVTQSEIDAVQKQYDELKAIRVTPSDDDDDGDDDGFKHKWKAY